MKRLNSATSDPARGTLRAILSAKDRDRSPGARELVALREGDDEPYLEFLRSTARRIELVSRFGRPLLSVAEFDAAPVLAAEARAIHLRRWRAARPIVLPGWAARLVADEKDSIARMSRVLRDLRKPRTLRRFLGANSIQVERATPLDDTERDLEKYFVGDEGPAGRMWVKSATLTSPGSNTSGRIRFSFGEEGDDDSSSDLGAHRNVSAMARNCLPLANRLARSRSHAATLERLAGAKILLTQHIAYWNAPEGGALLHHDAFHEPMRKRQRGVCYVQLSGSTLWLALCTADLARHSADVLAALEDGGAPWMVDEHFGGPRAFAKLARRARTPGWIASELTSPGCGAFASLANYSPEFLGLLADAGHFWRLQAGDAIVLPNHGHRRTALHAVWCAGKTSGAALSMAIRRSS